MSNNSQIVFCASCTYQARKLMIRIDPVLFFLMLILFKQHFYSKSEMDDSGIFFTNIVVSIKEMQKISIGQMDRFRTADLWSQNQPPYHDAAACHPKSCRVCCLRNRCCFQGFCSIPNCCISCLCTKIFCYSWC